MASNPNDNTGIIPPEDTLPNGGLGVYGYLSLLLVIFLLPPFLILVFRRYRVSERINLARLVQSVATERLVQSLLLTNVNLSKRPLNQQLEAYLYSRTNYGLLIDMTQALLSMVSCGLVLYSSTYPFTIPDPDWAIMLEIGLTLYFAMDYALRMFLSTDRLVFYFSPLALLDFITIVPGLVQLLLSNDSFSPDAFVVSQTLRVFRVFRAIRLLRILVLSTSSSLTRQGIVLGVTVLAMVFAAAAIFQILDSTPEEFVPFHKAILYMTITIIGRPPVPTHTDRARIFETVVIFVGSFLIPAFIAEMARLYFEQQGREVYPSDPRNPHIIICGDVNTSRLRAFFVQFFHKSRDPELLCPVVVLSDQKYEGQLKVMIEQSRYAGNIRYIRGSARKTADLKRAAANTASTVLVLCHRTNDIDANKADSEVVSTALAIKNVNRKLRILAQIRRPRSRDHLMCLPGWRESDRAVVVSSLAMTLVGVGSLVPGLPTLLTNLIHQGNKGNARSSNPRRRKVVAHHGKRVGLQTQAAGMIVATTGPWWAVPLTSLLETLENVGTALVGTRENAQLEEEEATKLLEEIARPMNPVEEYTSGFAQEMFAFAVTPGIAGRSFSTAARAAYLRFGILFIGARVPLSSANGNQTPDPGTGNESTKPSSSATDSDATYSVLLFPSDLILKAGMYIHALAFDKLDMAALLHATGGDHAISYKEQGTGMHRIDSTTGFARQNNHGGSRLDLSAAEHEAVTRDFTSSHNTAALKDILVPWCFTEQEEDRAEAALGVHTAAGSKILEQHLQQYNHYQQQQRLNPHHHHDSHDEERGPSDILAHLPASIRLHACTCASHETWAARLRAMAHTVHSHPFGSLNFATSVTDDTTNPSRNPYPASTTKSTTHARRSRGYSEVDGDDGLGLSDANPMAARNNGAFDDGGGSEGGPDDEFDGLGLLEEEEEEEEEDDNLDDDDVFHFDIDNEENDRRSRRKSQVSLSVSQTGNGGAGGSNALVTRPPLAPTAANTNNRRRTGGGNNSIGGGDNESVFTMGDDGLGLADVTGNQNDSQSIAKDDSGRLRAPSGLSRQNSRRMNSTVSSSNPLTNANNRSIVRAPSSRLKSFRNAPSTSLHARRTTAMVTAANANAQARLIAAIRTSLPPALQNLTHNHRFSAYPLTKNSLTSYHDHILVCGMSDAIGLLLRALQTPTPDTPKATIHGLNDILNQVTNAAHSLAIANAKHQAKQHTDNPSAAAKLIQKLKHELSGPVQIVALCPISDRPSDNAVNNMHAGSSRWLSRITWVNGSPSDLGDLLRAGVETARAAVVLSTQKLQANPDGTDNLADDSEAIVITSAIYKLNPSLHIITEVVHGPHASYLRPCGTSLTDAEDSAISFVKSVKTTAALRLKYEARQKRIEEEKAKKANGTAPAKPVSSSTRPPPVPSNPPVSSTVATSTVATTVPPSSSTALRPIIVASPVLQSLHSSSPRSPNLSGTSSVVPDFNNTVTSTALVPPSTPLPVSPSDTLSLAGTDIISPQSVVPPYQLSSSSLPAPGTPPTPSSVPTNGALPPPALHLHRQESAAEQDMAFDFDSPTEITPVPPVVSLHPTSNNDTANNNTNTHDISHMAGIDDNDGENGEINDNDELGDLPEGVSAALTDRLARERIKQALGTGDSIGRTLVSRPTTTRPALSSVFSAISGGTAASSTSASVTGTSAPETKFVSRSANVSAAATPQLSGATVNPNTVIIEPLTLSQTVTTDSSGNTNPGNVHGHNVSGTTTTLPSGSSGTDDAWAIGIDIHSNNDTFPTDPWAVTGSAVPTTVSRSGNVTTLLPSPSREENRTSTNNVVTASVPASTATVASTSMALASSPKIAAPNDIFGAPAFAAGRAYSSTTLDALLCEAHFAPHVIFVIKQMVRASRKQKLQLIPIADAVALALLAAPTALSFGSNAHDDVVSPLYSAPSTRNLLGRTTTSAERTNDAWEIQGAVHQGTRELLSQAASTAPPRATITATGLTAAILTATDASSSSSSSTGGAALASSMALTLPSITTYGQLFEGLLRGWSLLPLGLYRRLVPGAQPNPPNITDPIAHFIGAFGKDSLYSYRKSGNNGSTTNPTTIPYTNPNPNIFRNDKSLLSYVFTNPPPDSVLGEHDLVYVLRPGDDEGDE